MKRITTRDEWSEMWLQALKTDKIIGFVPTMGALHEGHLELIRASKIKCDLTIVSIFVNPTQFNNSSDYEAYPNTLSADLEKLIQEKVDYIYTPLLSDIYPEPAEIRFDFGKLEDNLEGAFRPGHFHGVGLIVTKLFNIIRPHIAFFGQKDLQQVAVIKRLIKDLSIPVQLEIVPTKREQDGLAMSSRNLRLSPIQRQKALLLYQSLYKAQKELKTGKQWLAIREEIESDFEESQFVTLEYFELVDPDSFQLLTAFDPNSKSSICVAVYLGEIRLIDNISING